MPFQLDFGGFINFFFGMITGAILFSTLLIMFFFRGKNVDVDNIKRPEIDVKEEDLKQMILDKQKEFKRNKKLGNQSMGRLAFDMSYELVNEIALYFFPESRYPMGELSVHEIINLTHYISNRLDEILDKPLLKNTKNIRVTKILEMYDKKKKIEESKLVKAAKKYKVHKALKYAGAALNAINPVYWFRKLVINTSVDMMTKKVCLVVIGVVGEETSKIYSKKLFNKPLELGLVDDDIDKFLESGELDDDEDQLDEGVLQ